MGIVLQGHEDTVPQVYLMRIDPLANLSADYAAEMYVHADRQVQGFGMMVYASRFIFETL